MVIKKKHVYLQPQNAKIAQLVEHDLAKVGVAGSSPVFRSKRRISAFFSLLFARMAKLVDALVSGTSGRKAVQVRVLFRAQRKQVFTQVVELVDTLL